MSSEKIDSLPSIFPSKQINLGLDLRGGSHLLIEVDASVIALERIDNIYNDSPHFLDDDEIRVNPNQFIMMVSNSNEKKTALVRFLSYNQPVNTILVFSPTLVKTVFISCLDIFCASSIIMKEFEIERPRI